MDGCGGSQSVCVWQQTGQKGDAPEPRSGHTLSVLNSYAYMFGGCGSKGGEYCKHPFRSH